MHINVIIHIIVTVSCGGVFNVGDLGAIIVFFFMAFMFISIGLFASAITDSQIVSAIVAFVFILVSQIISVISGYVGTAAASIASTIGLDNSKASSVGTAVSSAITWFDPFVKTQDFSLGIFSVSALFFLLSVGILFIYLTYRLLDKKRWSQA